MSCFCLADIARSRLLGCVPSRKRIFVVDSAGWSSRTKKSYIWSIRSDANPLSFGVGNRLSRIAFLGILFTIIRAITVQSRSHFQIQRFRFRHIHFPPFVLVNAKSPWSYCFWHLNFGCTFLFFLDFCRAFIDLGCRFHRLCPPTIVVLFSFWGTIFHSVVKTFRSDHLGRDLRYGGNADVSAPSLVICVAAREIAILSVERKQRVVPFFRAALKCMGLLV